MGVFLSYALPGIPSGCAVALLAIGLVLTYRTTGVLHFAFAGQAYIAGLIYAVMVRDGHGTAVAAIMAIAIASPIIGVVLDFALFSRITRATATARVVVSLVVLFVVEQVPSFVISSDTMYAPPPLLGSSATAFTISGTAVSTQSVGTVIVALVSACIVAVVVRFSRLGLEMRAAVESTRLLELSGVRARPVTSAAWAFSSLLAGLAGVLVAPTLVTVDPTSYWVLFIGGLTAAVIGGFARFGWVLGGAIGLTVAIAVLDGYLPQGTFFETVIGPGVPFVLLAALISFHPGMKALLAPTDPLAGVDPPLMTAVLTSRTSRVERGIGGAGWAAVVLGFLGIVVFVDPATVFTIATGVALATVLLSVTLVTGLSGQLSLCQVSLAGLGAFACGQLDARYHLGFYLGALLGGAIAGAFATLVALAAQRLRGLSVMLLTVAFALLCDQVIFPWTFVGGGYSGVSMPAVTLPGIAVTQSSRQVLVLGLVLFTCCGGIVNRLKRGSVGLFLVALRESEAGAAAVGVSPARVQVVTFATAGVLAGVGGAFYGSLQGIVSPASFNIEIGLLWLVAVCAIGVQSVAGALVAGIAVAFAAQPVTGGITLADWSLWLQIGLALAAITYAWHPEGVVEQARGATTTVTAALGRSRRQELRSTEVRA